jgi:hypothetical protein
MSAFLQKSDLSVGLTVDGQTVYIYDVADGDRETFAFDAGQAVTAVTAKLDRVNLDESVDDVSTKIEASTLVGQVGNITVHSFVRGESYVLSVEFSNAAGRIWTRTLMIRCVA